MERDVSRPARFLRGRNCDGFGRAGAVAALSPVRYTKKNENKRREGWMVQ